MKKGITLALFILLAVMDGFAVNMEVDLGVYSHYIWHGINFDNRPVVQGSVTLSHETGLYLSVWENYSTSAEKIGEGGLNELDYTLGFAGTYAVIDYDFGYSYFTYPSTQWDEYQEFYAGIALNHWVITPSLYGYYDIMKDTETLYLIADLNYGKELSDALSLEAGASLGWGDRNYHEIWLGKSAEALSDMNLYTGLRYALYEDVSLNGTIRYSFFPDRSMADVTDENFWGGLNLVYSF